MARQKKSDFYHFRKKLNINDENVCEVLNIDQDTLKQYDHEGAPVIAMRLLRLWDKKKPGFDGWDNWCFSRGRLMYKRQIFTPELILHQRNAALDNVHLKLKLEEISTPLGALKHTFKTIIQEFS